MSKTNMFVRLEGAIQGKNTSESKKHIGQLHY
jgi:hypothetical protein